MVKYMWKGKIQAYCKGKKGRIIYILLHVMLILFVANSGFVYFLICTLCEVFILITQGYLIKICKNESRGNHYTGGVVLLSGAVITGYSFCMFFIEEISMSIHEAEGIVGICAILLLFMFVFQTEHSDHVTEQMLRMANFSAMSVQGLLAVCAMLSLYNYDKAMQMYAMVGVIFGVATMLFGIRMFLLPEYGYKRLKESLRTIVEICQKQQRIFRRITLIKSGFLIIGKLLITIVSLSVFMLLNAFYSLGMGIAKYMAYGIKGKGKREQIIVFRQIGCVIVATGLCYVFYSIRLFVTSERIYFPPIIANIIAIYTFIEFGLNIRNYIKIWNNHDLESEAIRHIRLSATLISFVMTQVAILSFAAEDFPLTSSGLSGIIFGGMAALIGVYMVIRSYYLNTKIIEKLV